MVQIREYKLSDKKALLQIGEEFSNFYIPINEWGRNPIDPSTGSYFVNKMIRSAKKNKGTVFVAEQDGTLVGLVGIYLKKQTAEEQLEFIPMKIGFISDLFVSEKFRGKHIGAQLIEKAHQYFKFNNCTHSKLEVFGPNINAHKFYINHGYKDKNVEMIKTL
jgi:GNAT superfamily N-acetyltransferase